MINKLFWVSLLLLGVLGCERNYTSPASSTGNPHQSNVTYNPEDCKTDAEGMVYFAVGREVFRRPYTDIMTIRGMSEQDKATLPPRPDPSEPEGCPDNPIWGSNFSLNYKHQPQHPENYPSGTPFTVEQLSIIALSHRDKGTSVEFGLQPSLEKYFERAKKKYNDCERYGNGLVGCFTPNEATRDKWSVTFKSDPEVYRASFGRPFIAHCISWVGLGFIECLISYNYTENLRIHYRFRLNNLPVLEIIEFDKGVRNKLESMRVNGYSWVVNN